VLHVGLSLETHARPGGSLPELLAALKFANLEDKKRDQIKKKLKRRFLHLCLISHTINQSSFSVSPTHRSYQSRLN